MDPLQHLPTEARNPATLSLDELTSAEIVAVMNAEDSTVAAAVGTQQAVIARSIDLIAESLQAGGRLIYTGAGTSGRLGVLDAAECPPTFQSDPKQVVGLIAGGREAMFAAVEGAEDDPELAKNDLLQLGLSNKDVVCGIASSGRTPYVLGSIHYARTVGAKSIAIVCNDGSEVGQAADVAIVPVVGPEVLTGSTRLKAGTATKMVLNMLSTGAMVRLGKTFGNLMVDLKASNSKLKARANRIVRAVTRLSADEATELLARCNGEVKTAIVCHTTGVSADEARQLLVEANGRVGQVIDRQSAADNAPPLTDLSQFDSPVDAILKPVREDLVIGLDGGGTNTTAILAYASSGAEIGRGQSGPSNIQAVGVDAGLKAMDDAIDRAFATANIPRCRVGAACLGLAGIDREEGLEIIRRWAGQVELARQMSVANDATLLLAAGTPEGWGLAVVCGTGSIAFVKTANGQVGRCGGWGYLLGDEGSGYQIALRALRATVSAFDRCGPPTVLTERFLATMNLSAPPDMIPAVYRGPWDRTAVAGLAPLVLKTADEGDPVAHRIVDSEARKFAKTTVQAVLNNHLPKEGLPVALTGGVILGSDTFRRVYLSELQQAGIEPKPMTLVKDPTVGAVRLARQLLTGQSLESISQQPA